MPEEQVFVRAFTAQIFRSIVPYFLASFVAFGLLRYVCFRVGLENSDVRGAEFSTRAEYLKSIGLELVDAPRASASSRRGKSNNRSSFDNTIEMDTL